MSDQNDVEAYADARTRDQLVAEATALEVSHNGTKAELAARILEAQVAQANAPTALQALRTEVDDLRARVEDAKRRQSTGNAESNDQARQVVLERERARLAAELAQLEGVSGDSTPLSVDRPVDDTRPEYVSTVEVAPDESGRIPTLGELPPDADPVNDDPSHLYPEAREDFDPVTDNATDGR